MTDIVRRARAPREPRLTATGSGERDGFRGRGASALPDGGSRSAMMPRSSPRRGSRASWRAGPRRRYSDRNEGNAAALLIGKKKGTADK